MKNPLFVSLCALFLISSCGVSNSVTSNNFLQKRKYTSGWHLNSAQKNISSNEESVKENKTTDASINSTIYTEKTISTIIEFKSVENTDCDTLILNDGKIIRVKILNTSDSTVHYTKCESDDPTEFTMDKKEIKALQYANGKFEFIYHKKAVEPEVSREIKKQIKKQDEKNRRKEWRAEHKALFIILMILLGIVALFLLLIILIYGIALIFGIWFFW